MDKLWISRYLSESDIKKISSAVGVAERKTSGEIVPVIVRRSSSVGHVPLILTLLFLVAALLIDFPWKEMLFARPWIYLWPVLGVLFFFVSQILAKSTHLQRWLTSNRDEAIQCGQRAHLEFFVNRVNATTSSTGILIFISAMERRAVILADQGISAKVPPETWQKLVDQLVHHLQKGEWVQAFEQCIGECGQILTTHFPMTQHDQNELSNQLVIKE